MKISRVDTTACLVGEGPVWDTANNQLYYLDIIGKKVHRHDPASGITKSWTTPSTVSAMALREQGGLALALKDGVYAMDLETGNFACLAKVEGLHERALFNDGKVDHRGRFVIGAGDTSFTNTQPIGGLYSLSADHHLKQLDSGIHFSNSPCWSPDGKTFYFSDSFIETTFAYDYDLDTGAVSNKRRFVNTRELGLGGGPDGATVDSDGLIWMAIFEGGKVVALTPDGKVERIVPMPVSLAVSVMFGGPDLDLLYVTTINPAFFNRHPEAGAGYVYVIEGLGARGLPEPRYAG
jgi:sugar lactone lactonase YvrE